MESSGNSSSVAFNLTNPEEAASTSPRTSQVGEEQTSSLFVKHQVSKLDTLAGLAIKYNVSVGDIKRANGLLSDNALYARGVVLIPTRHLPIGDEIQRICAQVLSGVSRDPVLHADSQSQPASAAVARIATTLNVINGQSYPEDIPITESAWLAMCQCGTCGELAGLVGLAPGREAGVGTGVSPAHNQGPRLEQGRPPPSNLVFHSRTHSRRRPWRPPLLWPSHRPHGPQRVVSPESATRGSGAHGPVLGGDVPATSQRRCARVRACARRRVRDLTYWYSPRLP
ncbi:hypothetical protein PLESTM_000182900 [Pleodorina starrii]|nr:hypothetical protein PLESTM_000182900 [Pleodorina starrii]